MSADKKTDVNEFDFNDIQPVTHPVKVGGKSYTLHEASTDAACRYRNKHYSGAKYGNGKLERVEGIADADPLLLSCCLMDDASKQFVTLNMIKAWPERIVKPLVQWIKDHSDIDSGEDPLKVALQESLNRDDSPLSFDDLCDWVGTWDDTSKEDEKLRHLFRLLKPTIEDRAKNEPVPTPSSSE